LFGGSTFGLPEKISLFASDITVAADGHLDVHETITVHLNQGRRGIFRDFPTTYYSKGGLHSCVDFKLTRVLRDGVETPYAIEYLENGVRVKIGDAYQRLTGGTYQYDIHYSTDRQLGFFKEHDELYWNITGNGWQFPIDQVRAHVHLPEGAQLKSIEAYTGSYGSRGSDYKAEKKNEREAIWQSTKTLDTGEGITLVATWQKGIVSEPSIQSQWYLYIKDNIAYLILILGMLFALGYAVYVIIILGCQEKGTIIPLFYPPEHMTPAQVRNLVEYGYDSKALAAELIDMAVHGVITIERKKAFLSSYYEIKRSENIPADLQHKYHSLLTVLFLKSSTISLTPMNNDTIEAANTTLKNLLMIAMGQYFDHRDEHIAALVMMGFMTMALYFLTGGYFDHGLVLVYAVSFCAAFVLVCNTIRCYMPRGKKLLEEIEGFKLFLKTDREYLHFTSTPPVRTPELYEKYLPYAVALDVEEQWTAQFASVFESLKQAGTPYHNHWYIHDVHKLHHHTSVHAAPKIGSTLGHAMSTKAPGSSSGSGGRGSSGGGGGGGGGGAW
jgi:uncharacterized membrane protein YgcG